MGKIITVDFRNDTLFAVERNDGVFVAIKPICDSLGVNWSGQFSRLRDDPVLSEGICVIQMPSPGGAQETTCLKMEMVHGWLFKIEPRRLRDSDARAKLITYQRECYPVLFDHFYGKRNKSSPTIDDEPNENESVKIRLVNESRQVFGTQAAAQLWFKLGLPVVPAMLHDPRQLNLLDYSIIRTNQEAA